jgi:hypothetical protein
MSIMSVCRCTFLTDATALQLSNLVFQLDNTTGNHQSKLAIGAIRQEIEWHFV